MPDTFNTRFESSALNGIIGHAFEVLDDGFIRVIDYMGTDESIVQAARVSYGKGTQQVHEDKGLIRYLMRHHHTTPFEMCELKLHIRCPMDVWRQWIRHRTASVNEYSTRYSEAIDAMQTTKPDQWRSQSKKNKQGSAKAITEWPKLLSHLKMIHETPGDYLSDKEDRLQSFARNIYEQRLKFGVAREQARKDLPLSNYTEAYWKINLHNLFHFLQLRMDSHAQLEIRQYANIIGDIVSKWVPWAWEAFNDYRLNSMQLSERELRLLSLHNKGMEGNSAAVKLFNALAKDFGWLNKRDDGTLKPNRERAEFEAKMHRLSVDFEW